MPIDVTADDPFSAGYKAIIAILKANTAFKTVARRFNDFSDGKLEKPLQTLNAADTPEITLVQGAFFLKPFGSNSKVSSFSKTYNLAAVGDTLQVTTINAIEYTATAAFLLNSPESVTWDGSSFCNGFNISTAADGTGGIKLPGISGDPVRGTERLTAIISIRLDLYVPKSLLPT